MKALYCRQSFDKKDSISIETQLEHGKRIDGDANDTYKAYIDKGYSGSNTDRPAFREMMNDIEHGKITKVIVYRLDRISRSLLDFANITATFKKHNVEFLSTQESFDTSTPIGRAMFSIVMVFAQLERESLQVRIKDNYYARGARGFYLGGPAPYGFKKITTKRDGKKTYTLFPIENEIVVLKEIFDEFSTKTISLRSIAMKLNEQGIKSANNVNWDSGMLSRIMQNPVYVQSDADVFQFYQKRGCIMSNDIHEFNSLKGGYLYGKRGRNSRKYTDVTNHVFSLALHKGIVNSTTFLKCQRRLAENKQLNNSGKGKHSWLTGLIKCKKCGYAMTVSNGGSLNYFKCSGKYGKDICDGHKTIHKVHDIEKSIEMEVFKFVKNIAHLKHIKKINHNLEIDLKLQIAAINNQINALLSVTEDDTVSFKYIKPKIAELDEQKNNLLQKYEQVRPVLEKSDIKQIIDILDMWNNLDVDDRKRTIRAFIKRIDINEKNIDITWKYRFNC